MKRLSMKHGVKSARKYECWIEDISGWSEDRIEREWRRAIALLDQWRERNVSQRTIGEQLGVDPSRVTEFRKGAPKSNQPAMCAILGYLRQGGPRRIAAEKFHLSRKTPYKFDPDFALYENHWRRCLHDLPTLLAVDQQIVELEVLFGITRNAPVSYATRMTQNFFLALLDHIDHPRTSEEEKWELHDRELVDAMVRLSIDDPSGLHSLKTSAERHAQNEDQTLALPMIWILESCMRIHYGLHFENLDSIRKGIDQTPEVIAKENQDRVRYMGNTWIAVDRLVREEHPFAKRLVEKLEAIDDEEVIDDLADARDAECVDVPHADEYLRTNFNSFWRRLTGTLATIGVLMLPVVQRGMEVIGFAVGSGT